jgi:hypothetical protein
MNHSSQLHRKLYKLFKDTGNFENRHATVFSYTEGRTENSSEMTTREITLLIDNLEIYQRKIGMPPNDFQKGDRMRKRILSLFRQYGYTEYCTKQNKLIVDFARLNNWMIKYGYLHKRLNKYKYVELPKLVTQVEILIHKYIQSV